MRALRWLILAALVVPGTSAAIQSSTLGAYPTGALGSQTPWFKYTAQLSQVINDSITVDNRSGDTQDVNLYPVDATPTGSSGLGMMPQTAPRRDAGTWIQLSASLLHLPPHSQQAVQFKVTVPPYASVGPHYAGIIVEPTHALAQSQPHTSVQIISRLGVRLYFTIPGEARPQLSIDALKPDTSQQKIVLTAKLHNRGNTLLAPVGSFKVMPVVGKATTQAFTTGHSLEPSDQFEVHIPTTITTFGFPRRYTAKLSLRYGTPPHYQTVRRTVTFWTGNIRAWLAALALLLLVASGLAVKYCAHRHRNRHGSNQG